MKAYLTFSVFYLLHFAFPVAVDAAKPSKECNDGPPSICGTDGITYTNECELLAAGAQQLKPGHCPPSHAIKPDGDFVDTVDGDIPGKAGKLNMKQFDRDFSKVKVPKFQGLKGKRPLNFDRKKVSVPTSKNLDKGKDNEGGNGKGKKPKNDEKGKKKAPQSWFGVMQDGQGTANLIQDAGRAQNFKI